MDILISFDDADAVMIGKDGTKTPIEGKYRIAAGDIRLFIRQAVHPVRH